MLFLRNKLRNICNNWIIENSNNYKEKIKTLIEENPSFSEDEYLHIYKELNNVYFEKANELVINFANARVLLNWNRIPLQPDICGFEIDYNNINIGMIYIMLYYCFSNKQATNYDIKIYTLLNHINHDILNQILKQIQNEERK